MAYAQKLKSVPRERPAEYQQLVDGLRDRLQEKGVISRVEYVGSAYKGTAIGASDYDTLFVKRCDDITAYPDAGSPHHALLKRGSIQNVDPKTTRDSFKGEIQKALNEMGKNKNAKIFDSGPAIAIKYYQHDFQGNVLFSVDIDLCYEVPMVGRGSQRSLFIPKSKPGSPLWKLSTELEEKDKMSTIDEGNGIRRQVIRILKHLKSNEAGLSILKSCSIEHAVYHLDDKKPKSFWRENNMRIVVQTTLEFLADAVRKGCLPHHEMPRENLLPGMNENQRENVVNRLQRLAADPERVIGNIPNQ